MLNRLPIELIDYILLFLKEEDRIKTRLVSRLFVYLYSNKKAIEKIRPIFINIPILGKNYNSNEFQHICNICPKNFSFSPIYIIHNEKSECSYLHHNYICISTKIGNYFHCNLSSTSISKIIYKLFNSKFAKIYLSELKNVNDTQIVNKITNTYQTNNYNDSDSDSDNDSDIKNINNYMINQNKPLKSLDYYKRFDKDGIYNSSVTFVEYNCIYTKNAPFTLNYDNIEIIELNDKYNKNYILEEIYCSVLLIGDHAHNYNINVYRIIHINEATKNKKLLNSFNQQLENYSSKNKNNKNQEKKDTFIIKNILPFLELSKLKDNKINGCSIHNINKINIKYSDIKFDSIHNNNSRYN